MIHPEDILILLRQTPDGHRLLVELWDSVGGSVTTDDPLLSYEALAKAEYDSPQLIADVLYDHTDPDVLEYVFENPVFERVWSAVSNPALDPDQYRRICDVYDREASRTYAPSQRAQMTRAFVKAAKGALPAEADPEITFDAVDDSWDLAAKTAQLAASPEKLRRSVAAYAASRHLRDSEKTSLDTRIAVLAVLAGDLDDATLDNLITGHIDGSAPLPAASTHDYTGPAASLLAARDADAETYRRCIEASAGLGGGSSFDGAEIWPYLQTRPPSLDLAQCAGIVADVVRDCGGHRAAVEAAELIAGRIDSIGDDTAAAVADDIADAGVEGQYHPLRALLTQTRRLSPEQKNTLGLLAEDNPAATNAQAAMREIIYNDPYDPREADSKSAAELQRSVAEYIEAGQVGFLIADLSPEVVFDWATETQTPHWTAERAAVRAHILDRVGVTAEAWQRLCAVSSADALTVGDLLFIAADQDTPEVG